MATKPFTVDGNIVVDEATLSNSTNSLVLPAGSIITGGGTVLDATNSDTDDLTEGVTNLYFTDTRADARIALQAGANLDLSSKSTTDLSEGTNLYYTDTRARAAVSATTGSAGYDSATGTFSIPANTTQVTEGTNLYYTDTRADARIALQAGANLDLSSKSTTDLAEGTNLYYTDTRADARIAAASITDLSDADQSVQTTDNVTFANITATGYIAGPATFTIDPAAVGDNTGTVVIAGNLQVDGTQTTINSTTVAIDDLKLSVATDAADSAAANGAGITVGGANANITYTHATTSWDFDKPVNVAGNLGVTGTVDGVDIAARDAILTSTTTTAEAALPKAGGTMTGDLSFEDNTKIQLGASNDLEIYHDGADSYISEGGTGNLKIQGANVRLENPSGVRYFQGSSGVSYLYNSGDIKLNTTSTGIDVTGTIVTDGLTVNSGTTNTTATFQSTDAGAYINFTDTTGTSGIGNDTVYLYLDADKDNVVAGSQIRLRVDGSTKVTVKDNGNVGIGTTNPSSNLEVAGGDLAVSAGHIGIGLSTPSQYGSGVPTLHFQGTSPANTRAGAIYFTENTGDQTGAIYSTDGSDGYGGIILHSAQGDMKFSTGALQDYRMVINTSGNVGIGTAQPDLTLHVDGANGYPATSGSTPVGHIAIRAKNESSSHGAHIGVADASPWGTWIQAQDANNLATTYPLLLNPNGGHVGIGTTNPQAKLHIDSSVDDVRIINRRSGTQGAQIDMLGFSSSPADGDNVAEINMGGYYVGTSSAYFGSIRMNAPNRGGRHGRMDFYTRKDSAFTTKMSIDEDGKIFTYDSTFGSQLYTDSNAASDPNGNESNTTTGWSAGYTGSSLSSVGTDNGVSPSVGSYQLKYTGTNNGARQDYLIPSNLVAGKRYEVTINARWYQGSLYALAYVASSNSGDNLGYAISPSLALNNSSYTETKFDFVSTHTGIAYLSIRMASTSSPENITYIDNISIKEINGSEVHAKDQNLGGDLTVAGETTLGGVVKKSLVIASTENPIYSAADADKYFTYTPEADLGHLTWDFTTDERIKFHARPGYGTSGYIRVGRGLDAHVLPKGWTGTVSAYMYGWSGNFATTVRMQTKPLSAGAWTARFSTDDNGSAEYSDTGSWTVTTPLTEPYAVRFYLAQSSGVGTASDRCYVKDITITNLVDGYNNISQEIVHHNGNVTINDGNLVLANGHGIDFSATSNGSGTTTSELLDDYEEGSWTPVFHADSGSTGSSSTTVFGANYTKVGNLVTAHCHIRWANQGGYSASGNVTLGGLPFTSYGAGSRYSGSYSMLKNIENPDALPFTITVIKGTDYIYFSRQISDLVIKDGAKASYWNNNLNENALTITYQVS